jgi:hypothetical protein
MRAVIFNLYWPAKSWSSPTVHMPSPISNELNVGNFLPFAERLQPLLGLESLRLERTTVSVQVYTILICWNSYHFACISYISTNETLKSRPWHVTTIQPAENGPGWQGMHGVYQ